LASPFGGNAGIDTRGFARQNSGHDSNEPTFPRVLPAKSICSSPGTEAGTGWNGPVVPAPFRWMCRSVDAQEPVTRYDRLQRRRHPPGTGATHPAGDRPNGRDPQARVTSCHANDRAGNDASHRGHASDTTRRSHPRHAASRHSTGHIADGNDPARGVANGSMNRYVSVHLVVPENRGIGHFPNPGLTRPLDCR